VFIASLRRRKGEDRPTPRGAVPAAVVDPRAQIA
jgi:hypothetical protein